MEELRARIRQLEVENSALREALGGPSDDTERAEREKADISELEQARVDILGDHFGIPVNVLVIDDDAAQQEMVQSLFLRCNNLQETFKFSVTLASSAEEGMSILRVDKRFNLILLDVLMPNVDGCTALPEIKKLVGDKVAIVMTSAHSDEKLIQACILNGAVTYLTKPLQIEAVKNIWQYCLLKNRALFTDYMNATEARRPRSAALPDGLPSCATCGGGHASCAVGSSGARASSSSRPPEEGGSSSMHAQSGSSSCPESGPDSFTHTQLTTEGIAGLKIDLEAYLNGTKDREHSVCRTQ